MATHLMVENPIIFQTPCPTAHHLASARQPTRVAAPAEGQATKASLAAQQHEHFESLSAAAYGGGGEDQFNFSPAGGDARHDHVGERARGPEVTGREAGAAPLHVQESAGVHGRRVLGLLRGEEIRRAQHRPGRRQPGRALGRVQSGQPEGVLGGRRLPPGHLREVAPPQGGDEVADGRGLGRGPPAGGPVSGGGEC